MAGSVNSTAALITADYPLALYLHCASYCLKLAVVSSLQVTSVRNMMGDVGRVFQFFAAHPREKMYEDVGTEPYVPRTCSRQTNQSNVPASTPSEYYCCSLSIPVIDHLLSEMQLRFSSHQQTAVYCTIGHGHFVIRGT